MIRFLILATRRELGAGGWGGGGRGDGGRLLIFLKRAKVMKELEHLHPFPHPHRSVWAVSVFISSAVVGGGGERGSQRDLVINSAARALQ